MRDIDIKQIVFAFLLCAGITAVVKVYAQRANLLDVPNKRSSHLVATPRGGGLSIAVVLLGFATVYHATGVLPANIFYALLLGGVLVAGIGFVDDHADVQARWRFVVQSIAAILSVTILDGMPDVQFGDRIVDLGPVGDLLAIVFMVWFINLYNFMDGIDGIAAAEALSVVVCVIAISPVVGHGFFVNLLAVFAAAIFGFLVWNWPPAKIFLGDVGSGFVGFVLAVFAIVFDKEGIVPIWCWLILTGIFVVDATVTLITRVLCGEVWYSAHKSHAYQKASRRLNGHKPVTLAVIGINLLWLLPIASFVSMRPAFGWWVTIVAWTPLVVISLWLKAGRPDPQTR